MLHKVTRRSGSWGRTEVTLHSSPAETESRSEKLHSLCVRADAAQLRIPRSLLEILTGISRQAGKDVQNI